MHTALFFFGLLIISSPGAPAWETEKNALTGSVQEQAKYDKVLAAFLDSIYYEDQRYRQMIDSVEKTFGFGSDEMKKLEKAMMRADSLNLVAVTNILDTRGWLGPDIVSPRGNTALFLVIQHAELETQKKYLPLLRDAVKKKNAQPRHWALMEDRVALSEGRKQIYGSQLQWNEKTGKMELGPIEDEANVDVRRASVGLPPLEEYLKSFGIDYKPVKK